MQEVSLTTENTFFNLPPRTSKDLITKHMNNIIIKDLSLSYGDKQVLKKINQEI